MAEGNGDMYLLNDLNVSEHFKISEFKCNDGSQEIMLEYELVKLLQKLRWVVGKPIKINSGYRTKTYNHKVGGSPRSQHLLGRAADIVVEGYTPSQIAELADQLGFDGIGIYDTFCHVDVRGYKARW